MTLCLNKDWTNERKAFCHNHNQVLCYECVDKYHFDCKVDTLVDPRRITDMVGYLLNILEKMSNDNAVMNLSAYIQDPQPFLSKYATKLIEIEDKTREAIDQSILLRFSQLHESVMKIYKEMVSNPAYNEYSSFIVRFNSSKKELNETKSRLEKIVTSNTAINDSEEVTEEEDSLKKYLGKLKEKEKFKGFYEMITGKNIPDGFIEDMTIDLSIEEEKKMIGEITNQQVGVPELKNLNVINCDGKQVDLSKYLSQAFTLSIKELNLSCGHSTDWDNAKISQVLSSLESIVNQWQVKTITLDCWKFMPNDLSMLLNNCSNWESVEIIHSSLLGASSIELDTQRNFKIQKITLHTNNKFTEHDKDITKSLIDQTSKWNLKDTLKVINVPKSTDESQFQEFQSYSESLGLEDLKILKLSH